MAGDNKMTLWAIDRLRELYLAAESRNIYKRAAELLGRGQ